jgi:hypothetical protein
VTPDTHIETAARAPDIPDFTPRFYPIVCSELSGIELIFHNALPPNATRDRLGISFRMRDMLYRTGE